MAYINVDSDGVVFWEKDPESVEKFTVDWTARLNGGTIATSTWIVPTGITENSSFKEPGDLKASIVLSGGTDGATYDLTNRITAGLETIDYVVRIKVKEKAINT